MSNIYSFKHYLARCANKRAAVVGVFGKKIKTKNFRMSDSKSGSKSDLNESNVPLLKEEEGEKGGETPEKEAIEMEEKADDSEKKEAKKEKKKKVKKEPGPSCIDTMSSGLDINVRDARGINCEIDVSLFNLSP